MILNTHQSILDLPRQQWNLLSNRNFPFTRYEFLAALERSNCLGKRTGWFPFYISATENNKLVAAFILYLKNNSYGEYIFDWAWANAWNQMGLEYYPKLTSAIPFTPANGSKFICSPDYNRQETFKTVLAEVERISKDISASSTHILFNEEDEIETANQAGFISRKTYQFHWFNEGYNNFEDFLAKLKQKKRQKIRRERRSISDNKAISIQTLRGNDLKSYSSIFYELYLSTIDKKMSYDYLTESFFNEIFTTMPENILIYLAYKDDQIIAGSLNFTGKDKLYGRYWGAFEEVQNLHFELCYYRPIEYAIKHKLKIFEAGAQGEHKIQRGFIPAVTHSLHKLPDHHLSQLVKDSILKENSYTAKLVAEGHSFVYK